MIIVRCSHNEWVTAYMNFPGFRSLRSDLQNYRIKSEQMYLLPKERKIQQNCGQLSWSNSKDV